MEQWKFIHMMNNPAQFHLCKESIAREAMHVKKKSYDGSIYGWMLCDSSVSKFN